MGEVVGGWYVSRMGVSPWVVVSLSRYSSIVVRGFCFVKCDAGSGDSRLRGNDVGVCGNDGGERGNDVGVCGNDGGGRGNDVGVCGNDGGERGNDVGVCGNDVGVCGNDVGVWE